MSKYIKLEDAIERLSQLYHGYEVEEWLNSLPTIEVSEDCISRADAIKAYNEAVDELVKAEMEEFNLGDFTECSFNTTQLKLIARKIENAPSVIPQVPSEDCISREYMLRALNGYGKDWQEDCEISETIRNAPSVVPRLDKEDLEDIKEHISESYVKGYMDGHAEGEWINQEQGAFYPVECSNCHKEPLLNEDEEYEYTKYCPNCGAKMKG